MAARSRLRVCLVFGLLLGALTLGACLYPDPDDYTGACRFVGRDDSLCGKCLVKTCPAAVDALCDGTTEGDYNLKALDACVTEGTCSASSFDEPFSVCLESCSMCVRN